MDAIITPAALRQSLGSDQPPLVIDVRRKPAFLGAGDMIRGALRRDPMRVADWGSTLPQASGVVVYCVHGHEVSQGVTKALRDAGMRAQFLEGGVEAWRGQSGELARKAEGASTRWVTRERPKIDRIACPWLVRRFVDPEAEFLYVPTAEVRNTAAREGATAYDIPDVEFSHEGPLCSFDAFLKKFRLKEPALEKLALIVRGADTDRLDLAPQAAGLAAVSLGLSRLYKNDHEMLEHGMVMYDALYAWCRDGMSEVHTWTPEAYK
jgi:rhodanese-related sulfurtransferase